MMIWNMVTQLREEYQPWMRFCPDYFFTTEQRKAVTPT